MLPACFSFNLAVSSTNQMSVVHKFARGIVNEKIKRRDARLSASITRRSEIRGPQRNSLKPLVSYFNFKHIWLSWGLLLVCLENRWGKDGEM